MGAALAFGISTWWNAILLGFCMVFSSACLGTRARFTNDAFHGILEFFRHGVPSAVPKMVVVRDAHFVIWPFTESKSQDISCLHMFSVPYGLGAAASTWVSNKLGAGNPGLGPDLK
ncbi:hypothetical protein NL676_005444 [Syzygium grande]|nr:hypothetical protein NL676_005444 [Syzygium grande]